MQNPGLTVPANQLCNRANVLPARIRESKGSRDLVKRYLIFHSHIVTELQPVPAPESSRPIDYSSKNESPLIGPFPLSKNCNVRNKNNAEITEIRGACLHLNIKSD